MEHKQLDMLKLQLPLMEGETQDTLKIAFEILIFFLSSTNNLFKYRRGEWFVHGLLVFVQFGVGVVYLIFIGGNLESLLPIQSSYILIFVTIPLAIFALFKSMKHLAVMFCYYFLKNKIKYTNICT